VVGVGELREWRPNRPLKKPICKTGFVWSKVDLDTLLVEGFTPFLPTWDDTDHLQFVCGICLAVADILAVSVTDVPDVIDERARFTLRFFLRCPMCGATGVRKVYLNNDRARFQETFKVDVSSKPTTTRLYIWGDDRLPSGVAEFEFARAYTIENGRYIPIERKRR